MKSQGFTLIELSIVLVIIGLIVGGVLVGRDLIHAAELRADIAAIEKFDTAVQTFRTKYNCIPGDCPNANRFFTTPSAENGNGDGTIDEDYSAGPNNVWAAGFAGKETGYAIDHLARAGLIAVAPFDANDGLIDTTSAFPAPKLPYGGQFIVIAEANVYAVKTGKNTYRLGVSYDPDGPCTNPPFYTPLDAYNIDSKLDDGNALTGKVMAADNQGGGGDPFIPPLAPFYIGGVCDSGAAANAALTSSCQYDLSVKDKRAGIYIRASF